MDIKGLIKKQKESSDKFAELQKSADTKRQEILDIEDELKRLQGEYRARQEIIDSNSPKPKDPQTIKAEPENAGK